MHKKSLIFLFVITSFFVFNKSLVKASEGLFEIYSTTEKEYRCFASSIQQQNFAYNVAVSCRNLIYPADEGDLFGYVLWAQPIEGEDPVKLGALGLGRGVFKTKKNFDYLFVTTERNNRARQPSGNIVMEGFLEPIEFLQRPTTPTPTPTPVEDEESDQVEKEEEQPQTARERLITGLKRAAIIIFILLIIMVAAIFILTRRRR